MNKLLQIWVPFLVIALSLLLYFEFSSVEKVDLDPVYGERPAKQPLPASQTEPQISSRLAVGQRYNSLAQLVADQQAADFVRIGYFGKHWPAKVSEIATDQDEIKFVRQNGTPHHYTKFAGYEMKMIRLTTGNKETIVVFRSAEKK